VHGSGEVGMRVRLCRPRRGGCGWVDIRWGWCGDGGLQRRRELL